MSLLDKASLIQIPSGYGDGKLYSVVPDNGDGDFTFARSSSATRVNSEGLIEEMSANVPRLDYSGGASCASLLLEPQRTNLQTYSEDLTNGAWITSNSSVVPNQTTSPDGTTTADKVDYGSGSGFIRNQVSTTSPATTFSIFVKYFDFQWIQIMTSGDVNHYANFDVQNGVLGNVGSSTEAEIEDYGNGWYRIVAKFVSGTFAGQPRLYKISSGVRPWAGGDGAAGSYYMWGGQQEVGAFQTSYIPTTSSTVTRTADVCNNAGTAATFNSTEGVLFAEIAALANDGRIALNDGTANNNVRLVYNSSLNRIEGVVYNGANQAFLNYTLPSVNSFYKIAFKYKASDFSLYVNGLEVDNQIGSGVTFSENTLSQIDFDAGNGLVPFYGKTKQLMVFNEALSDEELAALTAL